VYNILGLRLWGGGYGHTDRKIVSYASFYIFQNKEIKVKLNVGGINCKDMDRIQMVQRKA
jgi:hypothetical protein